MRCELLVLRGYGGVYIFTGLVLFLSYILFQDPRTKYEVGERSNRDPRRSHYYGLAGSTIRSRFTATSAGIKEQASKMDRGAYGAERVEFPPYSFRRERLNGIIVRAIAGIGGGLRGILVNLLTLSIAAACTAASMTRSSLHAVSRIRVATHPLDGRISSVSPARRVDTRRLGTVTTRATTSTMHRFTNAGIGSCKNVNKLGAMSMHKLKTARATMDCSSIIIDGYLAKRISLKHFISDDLNGVTLRVKRDSGVLSATHTLTSKDLIDLDDRRPG